MCGYYVACGLAHATKRPVVFQTRQGHWLDNAENPGVTLTHDNEMRGPDANTYYTEQLRANRTGDRTQWYADRVAEAYGLPRFAPRRPQVVRLPELAQPRTVYLSPFSAHKPREWELYKWCYLARLLVAYGLRVVVGAPANRKDDLLASLANVPGVQYSWGQSVTWVLDQIGSAALVIGNDSGMVHVAGLMDVPAVAVMAHVSPGCVFGKCALSVSAVTPPERFDCRFCGWREELGFRKFCRLGCAALSDISVIAVYDEAVKRLAA